MIFPERTSVGHHQTDKHWNCFTGNVWETFETHSGAHYKLFRVHRYHLELNCKKIKIWVRMQNSSSFLYISWCFIFKSHGEEEAAEA